MILFTRPVTAAAALALVGVVLLAFAIVSGAESALLAVDGTHTQGRVTTKRIDPSYFTKGEDTNGYFIAYSFRDEGARQIASEDLDTHDRYQAASVGQAVGVVYVQGLAVQIHGLEQDAGDAAGSLLALTALFITGLVFAAYGGRFVLHAAHAGRLRARLLAIGTATKGTVIDNDAAELWVRFNLQRRLRYRYVDAAGATHEGVSDWMPRVRALSWRRGSAGEVRYDPRRPSVSRWLGHVG